MSSDVVIVLGVVAGAILVSGCLWLVLLAMSRFWPDEGKQERERMYEGATRVAAGADSFVSRHGRVPTTDELRAEITLLDGPLSNRIALQRMEALAAQGVPEQVMMDGEAGMAALETALSVLSPEERRSYVESLGPDTRGPARLP